MLATGGRVGREGEAVVVHARQRHQAHDVLGDVGEDGDGIEVDVQHVDAEGDHGAEGDGDVDAGGEGEEGERQRGECRRVEARGLGVCQVDHVDLEAGAGGDGEVEAVGEGDGLEELDHRDYDGVEVRAEREEAWDLMEGRVSTGG